MTKLFVSFGAAFVTFLVLVLATFHPFDPQRATGIGLIEESLVRGAIAAAIVFGLSMLAFRAFAAK
jgi:hypothetical protein